MSSYPLGQNEADTITSKTGKKLSDITLDEVKRGNVQAEDIKISPEMLKRQGQVAKEADNPQMEANFQRASELANVPDEVILNMYNKLRPNRSTKTELVLMAQELLEKYSAPHCAKLVLEAAEIYEKKGNSSLKLIAGVDIGNSTTEVCIGSVGEDGSFHFLSGASRMTTGTKGTLPNVHGIKSALLEALDKIRQPLSTLDLVRLNEAAPVIGDTAMETITETIITESSMIGHNPSTPAGAGEASGYLLHLENIWKGKTGVPYIVVAANKFSYEEVAARLNQHIPELDIRGLILQADEAVLVENRLNKQIPIIDEVRHISRVPEDKLAAIEVALPGTGIRMLSNPYGIATLLGLNPEETRAVTPIAKSLIGKRSAVVIRTPNGNIRENVLPAGEIHFHGSRELSVNIDTGADSIMETLQKAGQIRDISGQQNTNVGNMLDRIKKSMTDVASDRDQEVRITDILAVDTLAPVEISGSLAGETCMEKAVGIAAMVKTKHLPMQKIAEKLEQELKVKAVVAGVEAVMASLGALTTPGTRLPLAILDMGGGSTDAAVLEENGTVRTTHQAGAGELVTMLIQTELGLGSRTTAEQIKKYPMGKVESLFHMRLENGSMQFFEESIDPGYYGHVVLLAPGEMLKVEEDIPMEKILEVRREAKRKVFVRNAVRALKIVAPEHDLRKISNVVLVGGSAEDFEIPEMLTEALAEYRIVCGRGKYPGNRGSEKRSGHRFVNVIFKQLTVPVRQTAEFQEEA